MRIYPENDEWEIMLLTDTEDAFALDVRVVIDISPDEAAAPCGTDDGCDPTCASSCVSDGV